MMKNTVSVSVALTEHQTLTLETGLMARQAAGAVVAYLNENTVVFSAVTNTSAPREGIDYFPLQVEYREKFYASGKFPGGFFKRETRPSERETLIARATDRPIRPLFPDGYRNDVQIVNTLLSSDRVYDPDFLSVVAASSALTISEIPFMGPIGAVRIGRIDGKFVVNPSQAQRAKSDLDLLYSGTREKFLMMEGGANEISKEDFFAAMKFGHEIIVKIVDLQHELRRKLGKADKVVVQGEAADKALLDAARAAVGDQLAETLLVPGKLERQDAVTAIKATLKEKLLAEKPDMAEEAFRAVFDALEIEMVRKNVLERGKRIDGRGQKELRPLAAQVGVLPRTHGSAIFDRGETQSLGTVTLGTKSDEQEMDSIAGGPTAKSFFLHYNFPPYSVGEVGRLGSTGRREVGHGALAERSLLPVIPADYPYTVRLVSEIMGSNGSSSMASICVGTLALMDAGVPITAPVAGISAGLFTDESGKSIVVTDILGAEDHCGDMDFKVGGTRKGITGFQVDLKIPGLTWEQVHEALEQTHDARMKILDYMESVIAAPRAELSPHAPRITTVKIPEDKIGELIGPGGKNIRAITELTGTQIDIAEDGTVSIFATSEESMELAKREVLKVAAEPEEGMIYDGVVTGVKEFGAFVEILPGQDGLCHISELSDQRVKSTADVCKVGDRMQVKCLGVDERGRVKLSRREALKDLAAQAAPPTM
ncbi:MAG: polyribonucleotide nucleotidyltransferase [Kiritimatiellaeota bacterium]|nr:polyribonucleotide nucleotidyltransferase [Kiritimatiellota bacterium]